MAGDWLLGFTLAQALLPACAARNINGVSGQVSPLH